MFVQLRKGFDCVNTFLVISRNIKFHKCPCSALLERPKRERERERERDREKEKEKRKIKKEEKEKGRSKWEFLQVSFGK